MGKYVYLLSIVMLLGACSLSSESVMKLPFETTFKNAKEWSLDGGATFDPSVSTTPGSGSIRLAKAGESWVTSDRILSDIKLPVEAGETYTLSFKSKSATFPPPLLEVYGELWGEEGKIDNSDGTRCANSVKDIWEENDVIIKIPNNSMIKYFKIKILMLPKSSVSAPVWIDDVKFTKGVTLPERGPKKAFAGSVTRVDALGNIEIKENGRFVPFFPIGIYTDENRADWSVYKKMGFNTNMWASNAAAIEKGKKAGLFSAMQIIQYIVPVGEDWIPQDPQKKITHLHKTLADIRARGLWEQMLFYYVDNEFYHLKPSFTKIIDIVRTEDKGAHPVYMLSGAYGMARIYNNYVDMTGTYVAKDGYEEPLIANFEALDRQQNQKQPVVFAQINRGVGENFRAIVYGAIAKGARGIGFWRDGGSAGPIEKRPVSKALPRIAKEIQNLMPLIRTPYDPKKQITCSDAHVVTGTRYLDGIAYMIFSNPTARDIEVTCSTDILTYKPKHAEGYFSHRKAADVKNGSFSVKLRAHDVIVVKLVR